jgi:hypothetical protein
MGVLAGIFVFVLLSASCSRPAASPRAEELQPLLGKTVGEVVATLHVPESTLRAEDEPPGRFWMVSGYLPGEPLGRRLVVSVSREEAIFSPDRKVSAADLFSKRTAGIAVSFPDRPEEVVVGKIPHHHLQPSP